MNDCEQPSHQRKPFGMPLLPGVDILKQKDWKIIYEFIKSKIWDLNEVCLEEDKNDPLLMKEINYGKLMLGFDFHLTPNGPKLIEINTNAGGLASVFTFEKYDYLRENIEYKFVEAILKEYNLAINKKQRNEEEEKTQQRENNQNSANIELSVKPKLLAIVDDNVEKQGMYPEMIAFSKLLIKHDIPTVVISQEDIKINDNHELIYNGEKIDMIYNRICDFRFQNEKNKHLRDALMAEKVVISPHPYSYVRCGDKRNLIRLQQFDHHFNIIPKTYQLKDKAIDFWTSTKKDWVFKPPAGNGSKGVYRGDKISVAKLKNLDGDTIVQEFCPPAISDDQTKWDLRVYTRDSDILGLATRHFSGQIMEMTSPKSGLKAALPQDICCFPYVDQPEHDISCDSFCDPCNMPSNCVCCG